MTRTLSRRGWLVISAITLAYVIALVLDVSPYVRGPEEWRWARWPIAQWDKVWPLAIALVLIAVGMWRIDRRAQQADRVRRWIVLGLVWLIVAAPLVQILALRIDRVDPFETLFDRAVDVAANSYFTAGLRIADVNEALHTYPQLMPTLDIHAQVHPPGLPLIYWAAGRVFDAMPSLARHVSLWFRQLECNDINLMLLSDAQLASGLAGMLIPQLANMLTVWGIYRLAKDRFGDRAGLYASAMWLVVPSVVLFSGSWSLVYPCLACLTWLVVDAGLRRRRMIWFLLAGLLLSISTFLELGAAALGVFLTIYILACYLTMRHNPLRDLRFLLPALIVTLIGVFSIWGIYQLGYGVSLKQIVDAMYPIHTGYTFDRLTWLINHPYELAVFVGLPIFCLLMFVSIRGIEEARSGHGDALSVSFLIGLIALTLVDPARDETARTWMLLMPFAVVVVSQLFVAPATRPDRFGWLWGLMLVQVVTMLAVLNVVQVGLYGLPPRTTVDSVPPAAHPMQVNFGGMVQLVGYELKHDARQAMLNLYWRDIGQVDRPYIVFNHVVDPAGRIAAQQDGRPQGGQPLMTCWQPGELYLDRHAIDLTPDMAAGQYTWQIGLYDGVTNVRVPVFEANGPSSDSVSLGQFDLAR